MENDALLASVMRKLIAGETYVSFDDPETSLCVDGWSEVLTPDEVAALKIEFAR